MLPPGSGGPVPPGIVLPRVVVVLEPATADTVVDPSSGAGHYELSIKPLGVAALAEAPATLLHAHAIVVEVDPSDAEGFAMFEAFVRAHAATLPVVAAVRELTVDATRRVLRAGAIDVLPLPFAADEFARVIGSARDHIQAPRVAAVETRRGKIVSFMGALGGCGTTMLATQTGIAWAATASVCLIDLDLQFGNAALYLDLRPKLRISDVIEAGERLDAELLHAIAAPHSSGLNVVASPFDIAPLDTLTVEIVEKMLTLAAQTFDIVLVDLPGAWTNWSLRVIELSDLTLLVTSLSVPGIFQGRRQLEAIEANGLNQRLRVVVNRVIYPMFGKLDLSETQALLGTRIAHTIANDYPTVSTAVDGGKPFSAVKSRTRVEKDVRSMLAALTEALQDKTAVTA